MADQHGVVRWANSALRQYCEFSEFEVEKGLVRVDPFHADLPRPLDLFGYEGQLLINRLTPKESYLEHMSFLPEPHHGGLAFAIASKAEAANLSCRVDGRGNIRVASPQFCSLLGKTFEEIRGAPLSLVAHPFDCQGLTNRLLETISSGTGLLRARVRWLTSIGVPVWADVEITVPDAEQAALEFLYTATPDAISLARLQASGSPLIESFNPAYQTALDLPADLRPARMFEDHYRVCAESRSVVDLGDQSLPGPEEQVWNTKLLPVEDLSGHVTHVVSISRDVGARVAMERHLRASEALHRSILNMQTDLVVRMTSDGRLLFANDACCDFLGKPVSELMEYAWQPSVCVDDVEQVMQARGGLSPSTPVRSLQFRVSNGKGEIRWLDFRITGIFDFNAALTEIVAVGRDITERKVSEANLNAKTQALDDIIRRSPGILARFDLDGRLLGISPGVTSVLGYDPHELLTVPADWMFQSEDSGTCAELMSNLVHGGAAVRFRHRTRASDGTFRWLHTSAQLNYGEVHTASLDITEQVAMEQALEHEQQFLETLFRLMSQGVVYLNAAGQIERANPAAERILGLSIEQMQGRRSHHLSLRTVREDGTSFPGEEHPANVCLRTGLPVNDVQMGIYNPAEQEPRWIAITAIPRFEAGSRVPSGVYTVFSDETDARNTLRSLKESEQMLRFALEASHSAMWVRDLESGGGYVSPLFPKLLGMRPEEVPAGDEEILSFIHPDDLPAVRAQLDHCFTGRQESFSLIHRMRHRSGRDIWISANGLVVDRQPDGRAARIAGTLCDVSEMVEARRYAEQYALRRRNFLANMSHEIRTPLNGILGLAALLGTSSLDSEQRILLTSLQTSGDALLTLVNDILDLTKIEAGKLTLENTDFDPVALAEEALDIVRLPAEAKGLSLELEAHECVPLTVNGDPARLRQVFLNLVSNAVKFTYKGRVRMSIWCDAACLPEVHLGVLVEDTGIGMTAEQLERAFGAFQQAERSTTRRFGGTGLGLAISKMLVEAMGGQISVESRFGSGTTFRFSVRLRSALTESAAESPSVPRGIVLLIEADPSQRCARLKQLRRLGLVTHGVRSPDEAEATKWDAILVAPESHQRASEWIARLRSAPSFKQVPVLLLGSALDWTPKAADWGALGFADYLPYPVRSRRLAEAIGHACGLDNPVSGADADYSGKWSGKRILVADDNQINLLVAGKMLEHLGCQVAFASNGQEAVDAVASAPEVDLVLMDCQMPVMDGLEATRAIRAKQNGSLHTPILALTAGVLAEERESCFDAGMDGFVAKPISLDRLHQALEHAFGESSEMHGLRKRPVAGRVPNCETNKFCTGGLQR